MITIESILKDFVDKFFVKNGNIPVEEFLEMKDFLQESLENQAREFLEDLALSDVNDVYMIDEGEIRELKRYIGVDIEEKEKFLGIDKDPAGIVCDGGKP